MKAHKFTRDFVKCFVIADYLACACVISCKIWKHSNRCYQIIIHTEQCVLGEKPLSAIKTRVEKVRDEGVVQHETKNKFGFLCAFSIEYNFKLMSPLCTQLLLLFLLKLFFSLELLSFCFQQPRDCKFSACFVSL